MTTLRFIALSALALSLPPVTVGGAATASASVTNWGPNGNGTLTHEDDLQWLLFHNTRITADQAAGVYMASFNPLLLKMEGQPISITGYMLPLQASFASGHFILTRRSPGCPYCPPNEPTEAIEIFTPQLIKPTPSPLTVEGKLHMVSRSEQGLFFRIDNARIS